jgi:hypothetical protein
LRIICYTIIGGGVAARNSGPLYFRFIEPKSFAGPDGRATFEIVSDEDAQPVTRWRRIGGHSIYKGP